MILHQYLHRDHLGSVEKITDESGAVILDTAFDPDGGRRQPDWSGDISQQQLEELLLSQNLTTRRGYTGHEHLDRTGLVHMNGRIYDPTLGRFLSPDPIVQAPSYSQSWNRYSYVFNNPMSLLDPTGYNAKDKDEDDTKPIDCGQGCSGGEGTPEPIEEVDTEGTPGGGGTTIGGGGSWRPTTMGQISVMSGGGYRGSYGRSQASGMNKESSDGQTVEEPSCNEIECVTVTASEATLDVGDITRNFIESNRNKAGQNFNAQRGDAAVYSACVNNQRIRDCMNRLDEYEKEYKQDKSIGKDPRVQVLMELMREVSKRSLCSLNNPCDLMPYYENGTEPPPLWPPEI